MRHLKYYSTTPNISEIDFIPNSNQLLCIENNRVIQLIDFDHFNDNRDAVYQKKETIFACEFLDEGKKLLTVCKDGTCENMGFRNTNNPKIV